MTATVRMVAEVSSRISVFERYPQMLTLKGLVPDEIVEEEVTEKAPRFEQARALARERIPTVKLKDVFPEEIERGRITLENFLGRWGNVSIEELCKLCLIVRFLKPNTIFEIGTYNGCTTAQMAFNAPDGCRVCTLDLAPGDVDQTAHDVGDVDGYLARKVGGFEVQVGQYFIGTQLESRITQLWGDSARFDFSPFEGQVDLIYVDAAHTYEYVKSDTENAFRMLRTGGVVIWHDFLQLLHPDVTLHLCELAVKHRIVHLRGTNLAVHYAGRG